jgi:Zincin-like metallopeptidase
MPPFETFRDAETATLAHELTHWTKHEKRLARDMGRIRWGDEGYAKEELVAELGSAFLCADIGINPRGSRRSRRLYRVVAEGPAGRQAFDLHRRRACATRRRLSACPATGPDRGGAGRRIDGPFPGESDHVPAPSSTSTAAAISGAIWSRYARHRPSRARSSRPCLNCARITARPATAVPPSVTASRACSHGLSGRTDLPSP